MKSMRKYTNRMRKHSHNDPSALSPLHQLNNWRSTATTVTSLIGTGVWTATKLLGEKEHMEALIACTKDWCP